ncbi:unnamed protein product [Didymodactylos carnosus]|uniref:Peptidase S1 domain-containing protein n=1 Tax=Didymodactylos carnosus TaxID=1234261 RepID=A0A814CNW3_9BILA|nr:unnamed protein product [Didymodactylos carnosus]CAF0970120.1 unnamed protein product [Didymodactylos carnosus]CAF3721159.1 unnamed protein product [Didymodactylos carnosus]CAF3741557.1 unnamed protein product [Didymodactylos carnosus]
MNRFIFLMVIVELVTAVTYKCNPSASCGCSKNSAILNKIVGGEIAIQQSWGWAVSIRRSGSHICGGSVISPTFILTAAHCITNGLSVVVGIDKLTDKGQTRPISRIYSHPSYNTKTLENDIALLQLSSPLVLTQGTVSKVCLPSNNVPSEYPPSGKTVVAIGWGVLASSSQSVSQSLRQVTLNSIPKSTKSCSTSLRNSVTQFCAGVNGGGKDTCQGDSGGPLMMFTRNQWEQIGIVSYGVGCALPQYAGVYTRVSAYQQWIKSIVKDGTSTISR